MHPPGKNKEVITDLKQRRQKADARRRFGELWHVESAADIALPDPVYTERHLTATDARDCSTEYNFRPRFCFAQRHGGTIAAQCD